MKKLFFGFSFTFLIFFLNSPLQAQYCTPTYGTACTSDDFINNFTLNTISNLNSGCNGLANNYQYTGLSTTLTQNDTYTLSVQSGTYLQGFGIWIDYNQNGTFSDPGEFVYASPTPGSNLFVDSITIPPTAAKGTTRMRVLCSYNMVIVDTMSCSVFTYGETEDYDVVIISPDSPPIASFITDVNKSCDGNVQFTDQSSSNPISWKWDFGDGKTSTDQNPTHTYIDTGKYTVTLITTNAFGSDTLQKTNIYQKLFSEKPIITIDFESGISSIKNYQIFDNTESNILVDAIAANSSSYGLILTGNSANAWTNPAAGAEFTTNPLHNSSVTMCIDASNTTSLVLIFDMKLIYQYQNFYTNLRVSVNGTPVSKIYQPVGATTNWSLEVVDLSSYAGTVFELSFESSCKYSYNNGGTDIGNGIYLDNIIIKELSDPPQAGFTSDVTKITTCNAKVNFIDNSLFSPDKWLWNFGDGKTDTSQNPQHTYATSGSFTVTLIISNSNGADTMSVPGYIIMTDAATLPFSENFETGKSSISSFIAKTNSQSMTLVTDTAANGSMYGLTLAGYTATLWTNPVAGNEFTSNPDHFASTKLCLDASSVTSLLLLFDYKLLYQYNNIYTNFRVTVNGTQVDSLHQPSGATTGWRTKSIDLTAYTGSFIEVAFESNCKYSFNYGGLDIGNGVYIDNVLIQEANSPPMAGFFADITTSCNGVVNFTDNSKLNATSYYWDFGDGKSDTAKNPTHIYSLPGTYTVKLISSNTFGSDTAQIINYINVLSSNAIPYLQNFETGKSLLSTIDVVTNNESYVTIADTGANAGLYGLVLAGNSATAWTNPNPNEEFTINPDHFSSVSFCIDASSVTSLSLQFDYQLIYQYQNYYTNFRITVNGVQLGTVYQPTGSNTGWKNEILDLSPYVGGNIDVSFESNCKYIYNFGGQDIGNAIYIDNVVIKKFDVPPVAGISSNITTTCDGVVNFIDASSFGPSSWKWDFGDTKTDTSQNPQHTYITNGTYTVSLIASNQYGSDSISITDYITVNLGSYVCDTAKLPANGTSANETACKGLVTDDGGSNSYSTNSFGILTIAPAGATITNVIINFYQFDFESSFDYLWIYDGADTSATLIGQYTGNTLPDGGTIISTGPSITLLQTSDGFVNNSGFLAEWNCIDANQPPVASFSADVTSSCDGSVKFTDKSLPNPIGWKWDFGDGKTDSSQNPSHVYTSIGTYTVTLITSNAFGSDTISKQNYINVIGVVLPYLNEFETDTTLNNFIAKTNSESNILIGNGIDQTSKHALVLGGNTTASWTNPAAGTEFNSNPLHFASASLCTDATNYSSLFLIFNYKLIYQYQNFYTNFRITANGNQIGSVYQPVGATTGWNKAIVDLSNYIGGKLDISFESNCKYSYNNGGLDEGNGVYIDSIIIKEIDVPPIPDFTSTSPYTCDGVVGFTDLSIYAPNSWLWDFGDGTTSTDQNPSHTYTTDSTYTVTLIATNKIGSSTIIKTEYIKVDLGGSFCDTLYMSDNTVQLDSSCTGVIYDDGGPGGYYSNNVTSQITIKPTNAIRVGIQFSEFRTESNVDYLKIYNGSSSSAPLLSNFFGDTLPNNGDMIISTDSSFTFEFNTDLSQTDKGFALTWQCFYLTLPKARFKSDKISACLGDSIFFTDISLNFPEGWYWDFGDGNSSTNQNPVHSYSDTGFYTITLVATNAKGNDTVIQTDHILIKKGPGSSTCNADVSTNCCGVGIHHVIYNSIDNKSTEEVDYYQDLSCSQFTTVYTGGKDTIRVFTGLVFEENVRAWIDFNNDSTIDEISELVFASDDKKRHKGVIRIPGYAVTNMLLRMRVASDYSGVAVPAPCSKFAYGQVEDYGVVVKKVLLPPDADFAFTVTDYCNYAVSFTDFSAYLPTDWIWDFGDSTTATGEDSVTHQYEKPGTYRITMIASNLYGSDTIIKKIFLDSVVADFGIVQDTIRVGDTIQFINLSNNSNKWLWDFGDTISTDSTSTDKAPFHSFPKFGNYNVSLISTNKKTGCSDTTYQTINVLPPASVEELLWNNKITIVPVPSNGKFDIIFSDLSEKDISIQILNNLGEKVLIKNLNIRNKSTCSIDISNQAKGIYFIMINNNEKTFTKKMIIK